MLFFLPEATISNPVQPSRTLEHHARLPQVAGWVEQPGTDTSLPCSVPIPAAKPPTQLSPLAGISLTSQLSSEADKDAYVPKSNVSAASEGGSALYSSLASERGPSPSSKIDFSKLFANVPSGATPAARVSSSFFSNSPSPPPSAQPSRLFAESPAPAPAPEGHGVQATPPAAEGKSKGEGKDNTPPEDRVPRSLTEIYSLSKQNKKRNKVTAAPCLLDAPILVSGVGLALGFEVGLGLDSEVGLEVDLEVGLDVGLEVDLDVGLEVDLEVGLDVGLEVGLDVGLEVDLEVGLEVDLDVGLEVDLEVLGSQLILEVGLALGRGMGPRVF